MFVSTKIHVLFCSTVTPPHPPKNWHLFENMMIGFDTDSPSPSISVHVAVDMQGSSGTSWVDFVDSTGACVVIAIYVITVNGKVKLGAGVDWGHKNEQSYEECLLEERKEIIAPPVSTLVSCTLEKCLSYLSRKIMQIFCSFDRLLKILIFQSLYFFTCTWEKKILQYLPAFTGIFFNTCSCTSTSVSNVCNFATSAMIPPVSSSDDIWGFPAGWLWCLP